MGPMQVQTNYREKYLGKLPLGNEISGMRKIIKIKRIGKNAAGIKDNRCVGLEA